MTSYSPLLASTLGRRDVVPDRGLSRFAADLPTVEEFVSLGEGGTPLLALDALAEKLNLRGLWAKMETYNPTGSYKDRVAAMSLSLARDRQKAGWIATSSGNAGLAMAAYGARAGIPGFLCMVASAPLEKRLPLMPYGIGLIGVEGIGAGSTKAAITSVLEQVDAAVARYDLYLAITLHSCNPDGMRGIDTIAFEIAEQMPSVTHAYVPTGGGGLLAAIERGFRNRGRDVAMIACQPEGCAPIVQFLNGVTGEPEVAQCESGISALQIPNPPDGQLAAEAVARSHGWGTAASDVAILAAQRLLAATEGIFVEPAAAAGLAALLADVEGGLIEPADEPVLILTGAGWKDLSRFDADASKLSIVGFNEVSRSVDEWAVALS